MRKMKAVILTALNRLIEGFAVPSMSQAFYTSELLQRNKTYFHYLYPVSIMCLLFSCTTGTSLGKKGRRADDWSLTLRRPSASPNKEWKDRSVRTESTMTQIRGFLKENILT